MGAFRLLAVWRTLTEPFRSPGLIIGVIGAFMVGSGLVASGAVYAEAASNRVAASGTASASLDTAGIDVRIEARPDPMRFVELDTEVHRRLIDSGIVADPALTIYSTAEGTVGLVEGRSDGRRLRLMARDGAIESLEPIDVDPSIDGAWISQSFAQATNASVGDPLDVMNTGFRVSLPIAGIYRDIFPSEPGDYWSTLPADLRPLYFPASGRVNTEMAVVSIELMLQTDAIGWMRWQAPLSERPDTLDGLRAAERFVSNFDSDFLRSGGDLLLEVTGTQDPSFVTVSDLPAIRDDVETAVGSLSEPLATIRWAGVILGLAIAAAAALFASGVNTRVIRVLISDGDSPLRIGLRTSIQVAAPAALGTAAGLGLATVAVSMLGPNAPFSLTAINAIDIGVVTLIGLVLIMIITAVVAVDRAFPKAAAIEIHGNRSRGPGIGRARLVSSHDGPFVSRGACRPTGRDVSDRRFERGRVAGHESLRSDRRAIRCLREPPSYAILPCMA